MGVAETFNRNFNKCMRGYTPEEVDAAIDALLRYCTDLESANAEFEVANNELIDERTSLIEEKENLLKENSKKAEESRKIETVYNDYRQKFGEARDLIVNAKRTSSDLITAAEKNAKEIIEKTKLDAEADFKSLKEEKEKELNELNLAISKKMAIIKKLEACYNEFISRIKAQAYDFQDAIEKIPTNADYSDIPDITDIAPYVEEKNIDTEIPLEESLSNEPDFSSSTPNENVVNEKEDEYIEFEEENSDNVVFSNESEENIKAEQINLEFPNNSFSNLGPIWTSEEKSKSNSQIISSVNQINDRIKARKNNKPHIN